MPQQAMLVGRPRFVQCVNGLRKVPGLGGRGGESCSLGKLFVLWSRMTIRHLATFIPLLLTGCVYGPESPNVRIVNLVAQNVRVETVEDGKQKVQVISTGATALDYAPAATVYGPNATTRISAGSIESLKDSSGRGYRYACRHERGVGRNDVVFDVMVDEEGHAWAKSPDGRRVPYPAEVIRPQQASTE